MHMEEMISASPDACIFPYTEYRWISLCDKFSFLLINSNLLIFTLPASPCKLVCSLAPSPQSTLGVTWDDVSHHPNIPTEQTLILNGQFAGIFFFSLQHTQYYGPVPLMYICKYHQQKTNKWIQ